MDEIILRTSKGADIGVELDAADEETSEPLWAVRVDQLLTTSELLALADAIREAYGPRHTSDCATEKDAGEPGSAGVGCTCFAKDVAHTLQDMRARAPASRYYPCSCGVVIEATAWLNRSITCPGCETRYVERDAKEPGASILRRIPGGDVIIEQMHR
jgi:hypothetical protein